MSMRVVLLFVLSATADAYLHCNGAPLCGVLTLESGLGYGTYHHPDAVVHGLWPQVPPFGDSQCIAPRYQGVERKVYSCYRESGRGALSFETHEWNCHGMCAGVDDADDYFTQICQLSDKPLGVMEDSRANGFAAVVSALRQAGYPVYKTDDNHKQVMLTACSAADGKWKLAPAWKFKSTCGGGAPAPAPAPWHRPAPAPGLSCAPSQRGPSCKSNYDCTKYSNCKRCARSGFCTSTGRRLGQETTNTTMFQSRASCHGRAVQLAHVDSLPLASSEASSNSTKLTATIAMAALAAVLAVMARAFHARLSLARSENSEQYISID